ncbi:MAG TPA: hypothetical protein VGI24_06280 [Solirubrobacteraceae bacterium]|jgi:hypothetical protein
MWWQAIPRRRRLAIVATAVVLLVVVGALLARYLFTENVERRDILAVLQAQARGDAQRELALLDGCRAEPSCAATVRASALKLERAGEIKILSIKAPTAGALSETTGTARVAWTVIGRLPIVQCFVVRRTGNALQGLHVSLLSLSAPIENEANC